MTSNPLTAMAMNYSHTKVQSQRSVGSEDRVETNGQTEGWTEVIALPPTLMQLVINIQNDTAKTNRSYNTG